MNALLVLTKDPDPAFAKAASEMTLALSDAKALPVWIKLVDDRDLWVRTRAVETLGRAGKGSDEVLARLLAALKDPDLVIPAASALGELGDKRAAQPLLDAFKGAATRPDVQMEILDAMGKLALAEPSVQPQIATICTRVAQMAQLDAAVRERARRLVGKLSGDEARDALPDIEPEIETVDLAGNHGRPARRVPRRHRQARGLRPPPRRRLRAPPARAGPPRARGRAAHDARARDPAHPRGARARRSGSASSASGRSTSA